jgi:high-affinity iron transporter
MARTAATAIAVLLMCWGCDLGDRTVPQPYRGLAVPEATLASDEARERGRSLFLRHCALCHGEEADGRGERRAALSTPAVDFGSRLWRGRATPRGAFAVIREGVRGTAMPGWPHLSDEEVWSLVAYLLSVAEEGP